MTIIMVMATATAIIAAIGNGFPVMAFVLLKEERTP